MAKTAVINRDQKRRKLVKKHAARRAELLAIANSPKAAQEDALRSAIEAAEAATRRVSGPLAQPLRTSQDARAARSENSVLVVTSCARIAMRARSRHHQGSVVVAGEEMHEYE
jgi:hypothetical protein